MYTEMLLLVVPDVPFLCVNGLSERSASSSCTQDPADQCVANASCANNETCTCEDGFYQDSAVCTASKCEL